jgi:hypothetical protein
MRKCYADTVLLVKANFTRMTEGVNKEAANSFLTQIECTAPLRQCDTLSLHRDARYLQNVEHYERTGR